MTGMKYSGAENIVQRLFNALPIIVMPVCRAISKPILVQPERDAK